MVILDKIRTFLENLEQKTFYTYIIGYLIGCVLLAGLIVFYFYSSTIFLQKKIKKINHAREDNVKVLLETASLVAQQRAAVEEVLSKDPDFKIAGYFKTLLIKLNLKEKEVAEETTTTDREDNYRESELNAKFEDMSMKELTELLQELEQNSRISTKRIEITKAKKKPKTIEVQITITTLLPKIEIS